ncbi:MAG: 50S ribosomal protein L6 [Candidatus Pacearchaeota archaeon]
MKNNFEILVEIPEGINCKVVGHSIQCSKGGVQTDRKIEIAGVNITVSGKEIVMSSKKTNKKDIAKIKSQVAHLKNNFLGLNERFVYELEVCNVHFPMTVKVDGSRLVINNFLGEKQPRIANILPGVELKIEGTKIRIMSADIEKAGQTAANVEKASTVRNKDRRIFQDGIFITKKPEVIL